MKPFSFFDELLNFTKSFPYIYTEHADFTDAQYIDHFINDKKCRHTYRMPFSVYPSAFVNDFRANIVQTYTKQAPNGQAFILTILQFSPTEHASLAYAEEDEKFVASVFVYVKDPRKILELQTKFEPYKFDTKPQRAVGFMAALGHN